MRVSTRTQAPDLAPAELHWAIDRRRDDVCRDRVHALLKVSGCQGNYERHELEFPLLRERFELKVRIEPARIRKVSFSDREAEPFFDCPIDRE